MRLFSAIIFMLDLQVYLLNILFIGALVGLFVFLYKRRLTRVFEQKDLLESQVKQRTIEIIKQKQQVEKQKKMLEEEKEKTVDEAC